MQDVLESNYEMGEMSEKTMEVRQWREKRSSRFPEVVLAEPADEGFQIDVESESSLASRWGNACEEPAGATTAIWSAGDREPVMERLRAASLLHAVMKKYLSPASDSQPAVRQETKSLFDRDLEQWRAATRFSSNLAAKLSHPAYLSIIALGREALPLIFDDLRNGGGHWFVALRAITREDPVPQEHRSLPRLMREDWLRWGAEKGYINDGFWQPHTLDQLAAAQNTPEESSLDGIGGIWPAEHRDDGFDDALRQWRDQDMERHR